MSMARGNTWDYSQGTIFGFGTVKTPELFRINVNTKGNTISQEDFAKLEDKLVKVVLKINKVLATVCNLRISMRAPYDPDASIEDEEF